MFIKVTQPFGASLDDGLTVETFPECDIVEVPDETGKMAIKNYNAEEIKDKAKIKKYQDALKKKEG